MASRQLIPPEAAPYPAFVPFERRGSCRIHTVMRVARVERAHDIGLWRVRNLSDEGMLLVTGVPVTPGERLSISLSATMAIAARAVWWDGERCGVAFDRPLDCAALLQNLVAEQRSPDYQPLRLPVATRATIVCETGLHGVRLVDLSQHGAGFTHDGGFAPGMNVKLHLPSGGEHRGVVRWSRDGRAGLYLIEPFPCAQLESAARL